MSALLPGQPRALDTIIPLCPFFRATHATIEIDRHGDPPGSMCLILPCMSVRCTVTSDSSQIAATGICANTAESHDAEILAQTLISEHSTAKTPLLNNLWSCDGATRLFQTRQSRLLTIAMAL